jgi:hypothetical protein
VKYRKQAQMKAMLDDNWAAFYVLYGQMILNSFAVSTSTGLSITLVQKLNS